MAPRGPLQRLRQLCLALPECVEKETWEIPTFRVRNKIFAMFTENRERDGRAALWCKALPGVQETLVGADPERFYKPPYVGPNGWLGVRLDKDVDWDEIAGFLDDAYRMTAPKRLLSHPAGATIAPAAKARKTKSKRQPVR